MFVCIIKEKLRTSLYFFLNNSIGFILLILLLCYVLLKSKSVSCSLIHTASIYSGVTIIIVFCQILLRK